MMRSVSALALALLCSISFLWSVGSCPPPKPPGLPPPPPSPPNTGCIPNPTPTVSPSPTPGPSQPPVLGSCPVQHPLHGYRVELELGPHGGQQWDGTPYLVSADAAVPPPGWTGGCGTRRCALSPEKDVEHGAACTIDLCGPELLYSLNPPEAGFVNWVHGYTAKVTMVGGATLRGCCSKAPDMCGEAPVP